MKHRLLRPDLLIKFIANTALVLMSTCGLHVFALEARGHIKLQNLYTAYPDNSYYASLYGNNSNDIHTDIRLNLEKNFNNWDLNLDYQLLGVHSKAFTAEQNPFFSDSQFVNDNTRLFNLTDTISENDNTVFVQRLDRFNVGYTGEKTVVRVGRQALSWGNGLIFSVMDIVNPFDPTIFDKEYKAGDDMFYLQYLQDSGNDLQVAWVVRRDAISGEIEENRHTMAVKYHGFIGQSEIDVLVAEHYSDQLIGLGGSRALGGAVVHSDISLTKTEDKTYINALAGISYSWVWYEHNFSGVLEFSHNNWGMNNDFRFSDLQTRPQFLDRIQRGETSLLGRNYFATAITMEATPLILCSANLFSNIEDNSTLLQLTTSFDWKENLQLFGAVSLPLGSDGTEFGGLAISENAAYLSNEWQLLAKAAYYF